MANPQTPNASKTALADYAQAHRQAAAPLRGMDAGIRFSRLANYDVPEALVTRYLYVAGEFRLGTERFYLFALDTPEGWKLLKQRDFDVSGLLIRPDMRGRSDIWEIVNENGKILGKITRPPYGWADAEKPRQQQAQTNVVKTFGDSIHDGLGGKALVNQTVGNSSPAPLPATPASTHAAKPLPK